MSYNDKNHLPMLNTRENWADWINSIEDLAICNQVWQYCDPEGIENLSFSADKPTASATKDTIQKYQGLLAIHQAELKSYNKIAERIDYTVCNEFKNHYRGQHNVRAKLVALANAIQPTTRDQQQNVRDEYENLKKGPPRNGLDSWLTRWPTLVSNAKRYKLENLSEAQICDAFIEASRDVNPPFYNYMRSRNAQADGDRTMVKETSDAMEGIVSAILEGLNEISPQHASQSVTLGGSDTEEEADTGRIPAVQKIQRLAAKVIRDFRKIDPTLSDQKITISLCMKQFRSMQPQREKASGSRAAHATLQGTKHTIDEDSQDESQGPPRKKTQQPGASSSSAPKNSQSCICGHNHTYIDCFYLNPAKAPENWFANQSIKDNILKEALNNSRARNNVENTFKKAKIELPEFWPPRRKPGRPRKIRDEEEASPTTTQRQHRSKAVYATSRYAYSTAARDEYDDYFRLDNCADTHVCNDLSRFTEYQPMKEKETIHFGNSGTHVEGNGTVIVHVDTTTGPDFIVLEDVAYVPGFHWNLINTHSLEQQGLYFNPRTCVMEHSDGTEAFKVTKHGAFRLIEPHISAAFDAESQERAERSFAMALRSRTPQTAIASMDTWHARLGHIRKDALRQVPAAVDGVALGSRDFERLSELCPECEQAQAHKRVSRIPTWRGSQPFEKVHLDLIHMDEAFNADSWVAHFYCGHSGYHVTFNLPSKSQDELILMTKEYLALTNDNWGFKTRYIHSDGEKGLGRRWKDLLVEKGITFSSSPPHTPEQNGLAERSGGVIMTTARKLRIQGRLPHRLWPYIVAHATRLLNRLPIQRKKWRTPFEIVHKRKPNLSHVRIIGSLAYVLIKNKRFRPAKAKLQENALMGWLVGLDATNVYKVWIPQLDRVVASRDVRIDEKIMYDPHRLEPLPEEGHALSVSINEIDLDEEDIQEMLIWEDTSVQAPIMTQSTLSQALPTPPSRELTAGEKQVQAPKDSNEHVTSSALPTPRISPESMPAVERQAPTHSHPALAGEILVQQPHTSSDLTSPGQRQVQASQDRQSALEQPLTPISMSQSLNSPQRDKPKQSTREQRATDADVLQSLRTTSGRTVKLSKRGQDAIETSQSIAKRARRQAHALRSERAEQGQEVAHAFALASSIRTHREDLQSPPDFWHQLKRHPEREGFKRAADAEIKSLEDKKTFQLVDYPENGQVLPLKWVFTYKLDHAGYLLRHKARICVRGDLQHHTGDEVYAATGAFRSFRILMALVCAYGLLCHQIDFKNAFINADIDEDIYTTCPPGYGRPGKVWKLLKALYGLRKSPKLWFCELVSFLQDLGFESCPEEPCIFINKKTQIILFLYVDDLLVIAKPERLEQVNEFKTTVHDRYGIKDLGEAVSFLNVRIHRDLKAKKLWILQDGYIDKISAKYGIFPAPKTSTPLISPYHSHPFGGQASIRQITEMQEKVGSITYPSVVTRPDIAFAASQLSQHTSNPSPQHLRYADQVLSYLQNTKYLAIEFSCPKKAEAGDDKALQVSGDASFADDLETRKSTQGYLMKLFNGPIMWQSSKQKTVTTSTTEAELLSLSHTARETIALYRLFDQIEFDPEQEPLILCDNQQTVGLIQKERPQATSKLRHVDIHNLWLRQVHKDGKVMVQWVPTSDMPADGLTKPLSAQKHSQFIKQLGLVDISSKFDLEAKEEVDSDQLSSEAE